MTYAEREHMICYLKSRQHYHISFYKKLTDNQMIAIYYKEQAKPRISVGKSPYGDKQVSMDFSDPQNISVKVKTKYR